MKRILLLAVLLVLALPATALAAPDTIINFEGLPYQTEITTQYQSQGVQFGSATDFGFPQAPETCGAAATGAGGGINATDSAQIACSGGAELSQQVDGESFEFNVERRKISFNLEQLDATDNQTTDVRFYGVGGTLLADQTVTLPYQTVVPVSYDHGVTNGGIVGVVISGTLETPGGKLLLDDIDATLDDTPPPPKFSIAVEQPNLGVVEGSTAQTSVSVRRYNGSTGAVSLSLGALPAGVTAAQIQPTSVTGPNPTTLSVTAASPFTGTAQLSISATGSAQAGTEVGGAATETITGQPAVAFSDPGSTPVQVPYECGATTVSGSLTVAGGYSGAINLHVTNNVDPVTQPAAITANGSGTYPFSFSVAGNGGNELGTFTIVATPTGATPASEAIPFTTPVTQVSGGALSAPLPLLDGGSTVTVNGSFPCPVTTADDAFAPTPQQWPVVSQTPSTLTLSIPATARSGALTLLSQQGQQLATTPDINLTQFRIQDALSTLNSGVGAGGTYTWADFAQNFADSKLLDCDRHGVCVHDPIAQGYFEGIAKSISAQGGMCLGYSIMADRFALGLASPQQFDASAARAWDITPTGDGSAIKDAVVQGQATNWDLGKLEAENTAFGLTPENERAVVRQLIDRSGAAIVLIEQGTEGHAVVAYAYAPQPGGGLKLFIYDPNIPYTPQENDNLGLLKSDRSTSTITIAADGSWSGTSEGWAGPNDTLGVLTAPPGNGVLLGLHDLQLYGSTGAAAPARVSQISVGGTAQLDGTGVPVAGSGVTLSTQPTGGSAPPDYLLTNGGSDAVTVTGTGTGTYTEEIHDTSSDATVSGAHTSTGQHDQLSFAPGAASVGFATGGGGTPVTYQLDQRTKTATQSATIDVTAAHGAADQSALSSGALTIAHTGPTDSASITLGAAGSDGPASVQLAPVKLRAGQRLVIAPHSWSNLSAGATVSVKNAKGKLLRTPQGQARDQQGRRARQGPRHPARDVADRHRHGRQARDQPAAERGRAGHPQQACGPHRRGRAAGRQRQRGRVYHSAGARRRAPQGRRDGFGPAGRPGRGPGRIEPDGDARGQGARAQGPRQAERQASPEARLTERARRVAFGHPRDEISARTSPPPPPRFTQGVDRREASPSSSSSRCGTCTGRSPTCSTSPELKQRRERGTLTDRPTDRPGGRNRQAAVAACAPPLPSTASCRPSIPPRRHAAASTAVICAGRLAKVARPCPPVVQFAQVPSRSTIDHSSRAAPLTTRLRPSGDQRDRSPRHAASVSQIRRWLSPVAETRSTPLPVIGCNASCPLAPSNSPTPPAHTPPRAPDTSNAHSTRGRHRITTDKRSAGARLRGHRSLRAPHAPGPERPSSRARVYDGSPFHEDPGLSELPDRPA